MDQEQHIITTVSHSIPTPDAVAQFVADHWDTGGVTSCSLLRSYANDVFRLSAGGRDWIVKLYRRGWRDANDARWESELCRHIAQQGVLVALPEPGRNGETVQQMRLPEGDRAMLLTPWLPGGKPKAPCEPVFYVEFGREAARLHLATMDFRPTVTGRVFDGNHLVRDPMARLKASPVCQSDAFQVLPEIARNVADAIDDWTPVLPSGVSHGDLTLDNLHILPDGRMGFYDFDLAGHGPFAFDFGSYHGWVSQDATAAPKWEAFQRGYSEIRSIAPEELAAAAWFDLGYQIWDMEHTINRWTAWSGTWRATESIVRELISRIRESARKLEMGNFGNMSANLP